MNFVLRESLIRMRLAYLVGRLIKEFFGMCCFLGPARTSKTVVVGVELSSLGVHAVAYQNVVGNGQTPHGEFDSLLRGGYAARRDGESIGLGRTAAQTAVANAMIIHFPAAETMSEANMIDTSDFPGFLEDIKRAIPEPKSFSMDRGGDTKRLHFMPDVQIFEKGSYRVVLARDAHLIPDALEVLPDSFRPALNNGLFYAYSEWFPGWPIALCCFNNSDDVQVEPLLWWYKPLNPNVLFVPTLDSHDGSMPDLDGEVTLDHTIAFGSDRLETGYQVLYRAPLAPQVRQYLPSNVIGMHLTDGQRLPNGDVICNVDEMLEGRGKQAIHRADPRQLVQLVS